MPIVALSRPTTHTPTRTAKFRGAFANHFNVKWLVMAGSKDSPGVARSIEHWHQYRFFTPPANAGYALFVDVDRPGAVTEIFERLPVDIAPSWVIETANGAQAGWFIDPVDLRDTARSHPIRYARNVGKALRHVLNGDPLVDPLTPSRVRNPAYEPAGTFASPNPPIYKLGELCKALKAAGLWYSEPLKFVKSGRPAVHTTTGNLQVGNRNEGIFDAARFVAYDDGDYVTAAWEANDRCVIPLKANEVHVIINSIRRFMATKGYTRSKGPTTAMPEPLRRALSEMGRRGGLANTPAQRAARSKGPAAAATARKQRAQQHAKHAQHLRRKGLSRAQIAAKLGKHPSTISRYLRRWIPISRHEMLACVTGASGGAPLTTRTPLPHSGGTSPHPRSNPGTVEPCLYSHSPRTQALSVRATASQSYRPHKTLFFTHSQQRLPALATLKPIPSIIRTGTPMTSAEFKMIRRLLGITTDDVAATFNVALRSARRWETTHQPPQGVADWLRGKLADAKTTVYKMLDRLEAEAQTNPDYVATLPMYRTDEHAQAALGPDTTKEQHTAIMGLVAFLADDELELTAEYITQDD